VRTVPPFFLGGGGSASNAMWPGPRPTFVSYGILIHPAVWPQQTCAENWRLCPFGGELGPHLTQCGLGRGLPPCQVSTFILMHPTVWPQHTNVTDRQTDRQTGQTYRTTVRWRRTNRFTNGRPKIKATPRRQYNTSRIDTRFPIAHYLLNG